MEEVCPTENSIKSSESGAKDPYAYLDRDDFTSEKYKIEIRGLPKYYGIGELKKFLNDKLELGTNKVKPPKRGSGWVYVCFRSEESREHAIATVNGLTWKNSKLTAQVHSLFIHYKISAKYHFFFNVLFILRSTGSQASSGSFHQKETRS